MARPWAQEKIFPNRLKPFRPAERYTDRRRGNPFLEAEHREPSPVFPGNALLLPLSME